MERLRIIGKVFTLETRPAGEVPRGGVAVCDPSRQRIVVQEDLAPDERDESILHEIIHALEHQMKLDLDEREVHTLSTGLFAVCRDNPAILQRILFGETRT